MVRALVDIVCERKTNSYLAKKHVKQSWVNNILCVYYQCCGKCSKPRVVNFFIFYFFKLIFWMSMISKLHVVIVNITFPAICLLWLAGWLEDLTSRS